MKRWKGGTEVGPGFYWDIHSWKIEALSGRRDLLPGDHAVSYVKVPVAAMLVLAPAMGAALVMFLPLVGFAMVLRELGRKAAATYRRRAARTRPLRKAA
jgi:hypothetical protein